MASRLREEAINLPALGLSELAPDLETIAVECEKRGPELTPIHDPIVTRSRGDQVAAHLYPSNDGHLSLFV